MNSIDNLPYNEQLKCIAQRFNMTQEQALKTIVNEVYKSEVSLIGLGLKEALALVHTEYDFCQTDKSYYTDVPF